MVFCPSPMDTMERLPAVIRADWLLQPTFGNSDCYVYCTGAEFHVPWTMPK